MGPILQQYLLWKKPLYEQLTKMPASVFSCLIHRDLVSLTLRHYRHLYPSLSDGQMYLSGGFHGAHTSFPSRDMGARWVQGYHLARGIAAS